MEDTEKEAFYVVRKGDIIGVYKSFTDCKAQAVFSPLDPSTSMYKGYGLSKEAESFLVSRGLKQASFSIGASDVQDGLFGALSVCPFQNIVRSNNKSGLGSFLANPQLKHIKLKDSAERPLHHSLLSCTIEFDGASKGNPGLSGAGAVLRATDGSEVWRLREGVGIATNNVAEYRSMILGLRTAL